MITSFTLPKTETALTRLRKDVVEYYHDHQENAQAIVDQNESEEKKLLKLLGDVITRDQLVTIVDEEIEDIKSQEQHYKDTHPNFSPLKAAIDLATKYLYETKPEEQQITISMVKHGTEIKPEVGIVDNADTWYRFTHNDIDFYIDRVDYYDDYIAFLVQLKQTLQKETLDEDDKDIIMTYLVERREYWREREEAKALTEEDYSVEQLYKAFFQAFIQKVVSLPTKEVEEEN